MLLCRCLSHSLFLFRNCLKLPRDCGDLLLLFLAAARLYRSLRTGSVTYSTSSRSLDNCFVIVHGYCRYCNCWYNKIETAAAELEVEYLPAVSVHRPCQLLQPSLWWIRGRKSNIRRFNTILQIILACWQSRQARLFFGLFIRKCLNTFLRRGGRFFLIKPELHRYNPFLQRIFIKRLYSTL